MIVMVKTIGGDSDCTEGCGESTGDEDDDGTYSDDDDTSSDDDDKKGMVIIK